MGKCRVLSDQELRRIHQTCSTPNDRLLVTLFERTGYLPAAVATLRLQDVREGETVAQFLQIASIHMRGEGIRPPIALHEDLRQALKDVLAQRQAEGTDHPRWPLFLSRKSKKVVHGWKRETMWRAFRRLATDAGVEADVGLMSLYKVYTLRLYKESRWDVEYVRKNLGHSEIHTTFALLGNIAQECQQRDIPLFPNAGLE